jgi:hypothetical protein
MFGLDFGYAEMTTSLTEMADEFTGIMEKGMSQGGHQMVDIFRRDWLSGRGGDGLGLNIQSGRLNQSIRDVTTVNGQRITSEIFNRGATYWYYHQNPEGGRTKYLYLDESFQSDGDRIYGGQVEMAMGMIS